MEKVALVRMPWGAIHTGSIALGTLKGVLEKADIMTDVLYMNVRFASLMPLGLYNNISNVFHLGEWLFAQHVFGESGTGELKNNYDDFYEYCLSNEKYSFIEALMKHIRPDLNRIIHETIPAFIEGTVNGTPWDSYPLIGFTSVIGQHLPSVLLAREIKKKFPEAKIVFGGPNVFGKAGVETLRCFDWVDYVIDGEGEASLPQLASNVIDKNFFKPVPGVTMRHGNKVYPYEFMPARIDLDELPVPDYSDYYRELESSGLSNKIDTLILYESSRGCWWSEKVHCAFCGINNEYTNYRIKSPVKVLSEIREQSLKYNTKRFYATDSVLNMDLLKTLLPQLAEEGDDFDLFYEVRATINKKQLSILKKAGVKRIQPGIESLHTGLLKLMRKGTTQIQNIQLLKLCSELGIIVDWNLLYGIPGEQEEYYKELMENIGQVLHLQPPSSIARITLYRYSPYFKEPDKYGIRNITPSGVYEYLYPEDRANISDLAYFFDFAADSFRINPDIYVKPIKKAVNIWTKSYNDNKIYCRYVIKEDFIEIIDNRPIFKSDSMYSERKYTLKGMEKDIYIFCSTIRTFEDICEFFYNSGRSVDRERLQNILDTFVSDKTMFTECGKYIALAVNYKA